MFPFLGFPVEWKQSKKEKKILFRSKDQTHRETVNERFTKSKMILCCVGEFFDFFRFFCVLLRTFWSFPPLPVDSEKKKHKIFARGSNFALEKCFFRATRLWLFPVFVVFWLVCVNFEFCCWCIKWHWIGPSDLRPFRGHIDSWPSYTRQKKQKNNNLQNLRQNHNFVILSNF